MTYDYKFVYVAVASDVQTLLDEGWEPVPDVESVVKFRGSVLGETYVFLRRPK